jgi:hypothetical protein
VPDGIIKSKVEIDSKTYLMPPVEKLESVT